MVYSLTTDLTTRPESGLTSSSMQPHLPGFPTAFFTAFVLGQRYQFHGSSTRSCNHKIIILFFEVIHFCCHSNCMMSLLNCYIGALIPTITMESNIHSSSLLVHCPIPIHSYILYLLLLFHSAIFDPVRKTTSLLSLLPSSPLLPVMPGTTPHSFTLFQSILKPTLSIKILECAPIPLLK